MTRAQAHCLVCGAPLSDHQGLCSNACLRLAVRELDDLRWRRKALTRLLVSWRRRSWLSRTVHAEVRRRARSWETELRTVTMRTRALTAALLTTPRHKETATPVS